MFTLLTIFGPGLAGSAMLWFSKKCKGRNARDFFRLGGWGFLLLYLWFVSGLIPLPLGLNVLVALVPSVVCFFLAVNAVIREMRAQKNGEFTEAA